MLRSHIGAEHSKDGYLLAGCAMSMKMGKEPSLRQIPEYHSELSTGALECGLRCFSISHGPILVLVNVYQW